MTSSIALNMSFCPMREKGQFCGEDKRVSGSRENGRLWVAHEIIDDGEVDLFGGHRIGLGDEGEKG